MKQVAAQVIIALGMMNQETRAAAVDHDSILAQLGCRQLIVVTTASWPASTGTMTLLERGDIGGTWQVRRSRVPVVVGKRGMAWGLGAAGEYGRGMKYEGDNRAPAGVFKLTGVFGYAARADTQMRYQQMRADTLCIDDPESPHYNQVIDASTVDKNWCSAEQMRRDDDLYRWGVFVDHNPNSNGGGGSCIFLHIWRGPNRPTIGCTAMAEKNILDLIRWLDPNRSPLLVQLPRPVYQQYRTRWSLPALP